MTNPQKKLRELPASVYDNSEAKTKIMTTMTQEILTNYKSRISGLESDNKQLIEELKAITRNFEALSLKRLEDSNLIKRLENEITKLQSKPFNQSLDIKDDILKDYKSKNEDLNNRLNSLESIYKSSMQKQTEEIFQLKKVIEEYKEKHNTIKQRENGQSSKYQKDNEALNNRLQSVYDENKKLLIEIEEQEKREAKLNKKISDLVSVNEKEVNEKNLLYKLLEETREKLKDSILKGNDLAMRLKTKSKPEIELEVNLALAYKTIESLNQTIDIMKSDIQYYELNTKSLTEDIVKLNAKPILTMASKVIVHSIMIKHKPKQYIIESKTVNWNYKHIKPLYSIDNISLFYNGIKPIPIPITTTPIITYTMTNPLCFDIIPKSLQLPIILSNLTTSIKSSFTSELINTYITPQAKAIDSISSKVNVLNSKVFHLNSILYNNLLPILKELDNIAHKSKFQKQKHLLELKTLKEAYEQRLTKKRNSKYTLKNTITSLKNEIKDLNDSKIDLTVINTLFNQASEIIDRLNLTFGSLEFTLKCRNCNKMNNKMFFNDCSHSCCVNCLKTPCVECNKTLSVDNAKVNYSLNGIIGKFNYAKQQIESDLALVLSTIKQYLSK